MTADEKGFQGAGIALNYGRMLGKVTKLPEGGRADPKETAHLPRSVDGPRFDALGPEQGLEQGFGPVPEIGGRLAPADTPKTAWGAL